MKDRDTVKRVVGFYKTWGNADDSESDCSELLTMLPVFKMKEVGFYGEVTVPVDVFNKLDSRYFISRSTDKVKYMCANDKERRHLEEIGICIPCVVICDWYKICLAS